jgi:hypothetical protein
VECANVTVKPPVFVERSFAYISYFVRAAIAQSVLRVATGCMIGVRGFDSRRASRPTLGPTHPPIHWVPEAILPGVKRQGREADHSPLSSAEVNNTWRHTCTPQYVFMAWYLVKHRDNFTFTFHISYRSQWQFTALDVRGCIQKFPD